MTSATVLVTSGIVAPTTVNRGAVRPIGGPVASGGRVSNLPPEPTRDELLEERIALVSKNRLYERILRDIQRHYGDEPNVGYIAVLTSRIETLEANVERLSLRGKKAA